MNGRVNIQEGGSPMFLYEAVKVDDKSNYYNATKYMFQPNELTKKYFSNKNIELVHQNIKNDEIWKKELNILSKELDKSFKF